MYPCHLVMLIKGAVIKYGTEGDGRDLTRSPKLLDGKHWANKLPGVPEKR